MTRRRVAVVAPPWYPVPPVGYGGVEHVVDVLVQELRRQGVEVLLYGAEGSRPGTIELAPAEWGDDLVGPAQEERSAAYACRVLEDLQRRRVDLVHDHGGYTGWSSLVATAYTAQVPVVHTVHGPLYERTRTVFEALGDRVSLVAISHHQRSTAPALNWAGTVHNAADASMLRVAPRRERDAYLLCLARICPDKGQHVAIEVARRAGRPLLIAGRVAPDPGAEEYFVHEIEPHLDGDRVRWLPNVAGGDKRELLARAHALLAPISWPEPFGLAILEAMMSGTPALASPLGAMPELISPGTTGFLCEDADAMVEAVGRAGDIDPAGCAAQARSRFSAEAMADRYLDVYSAVCGEPVIDLEMVRQLRIPSAAMPPATASAGAGV